MSGVTTPGIEVKGHRQLLPSWGGTQDGTMNILFWGGHGDGGRVTPTSACTSGQAWGVCSLNLCVGRGQGAAASFALGPKLPCHVTACCFMFWLKLLISSYVID